MSSRSSGQSNLTKRIPLAEPPLPKFNTNLEISPAEKADREGWLSQLDWTREEFVERYRRGIAKGVVLAATNSHQLARETESELAIAPLLQSAGF